MGTGNNDQEGRVARGKVIVLGAHYGALSVVRALGREGLHVILAASDSHDHACHSKFVSELVVAPDPADGGDELLEVLTETKRDWGGALLIPTLDEYVIFVSKNQAELKKRFVFTVQGWELIRTILLKNLLYAAAREAAVPAPKFCVPDSVQDLEQKQDGLCYPCILKPYESRRFSKIYGTKVLMAHNPQELVEKFIDTQQNQLDVMVSEIIPGDDSSIFSYRSYIDSQGELLAEMCTQKLRQYPPRFGQGSVVRTIPMIPEIRAHALRLLRSLGYRGESSAEFRLDCRDDCYKLMEINVRPVVTEWLFVEAGINFPYITYLDLVENTREVPHGYDPEIYWIHNHWEMVNLIRSLRAGHLNLREFFRPYGKKRVFAIPFSEDPAQFLTELYQNGRVALRRMQERSPW